MKKKICIVHSTYNEEYYKKNYLSANKELKKSKIKSS